MIYAIVLCGSFLLLFGGYFAQQILRKRAVKNFVKSVQIRSASAQKKGILDSYEVGPHKSNPRFSSKEMQDLRGIVRLVDQAMRKENWQEAERLYIQALTIRPDAHDMQAELAKLYLNTGRQQKAEALYREILENSDDPACFSNLGLAYYKQNKFGLACDAYSEAYKRSQQDPAGALNLGRALVAAGEYGPAIEYLEKAAVKFWRDIDVLEMLVTCYEQLNMQLELLDAYKRINKIQPYNREIRSKIEVLSAV